MTRTLTIILAVLIPIGACIVIVTHGFNTIKYEIQHSPNNSETSLEKLDVTIVTSASYYLPVGECFLVRLEYNGFSHEYIIDRKGGIDHWPSCQYCHLELYPVDTVSTNTPQKTQDNPIESRPSELHSLK